jgi:hypothetical protein
MLYWSSKGQFFQVFVTTNNAARNIVTHFSKYIYIFMYTYIYAEYSRIHIQRWICYIIG